MFIENKISFVFKRFKTFVLSNSTKSFSFKHSAKSLLTSTNFSNTAFSSGALKQSLTPSPKLIAPHSASVCGRTFTQFTFSGLFTHFVRTFSNFFCSLVRIHARVLYAGRVSYTLTSSAWQ